LHGEAKADAVRELARREEIDLSASTAYSDAAADLPFLEAVGTPVAVNPDRVLRKIARERRWEVLEFSERAYSHARRRVSPAIVGVPLVLGAAAYACRRRAA
jgi:phosphoserine phosphatase